LGFAAEEVKRAGAQRGVRLHRDTNRDIATRDLFDGGPAFQPLRRPGAEQVGQGREDVAARRLGSLLLGRAQIEDRALRGLGKAAAAQTAGGKIVSRRRRLRGGRLSIAQGRGRRLGSETAEAGIQLRRPQHADAFGQPSQLLFQALRLIERLPAESPRVARSLAVGRRLDPETRENGIRVFTIGYGADFDKKVLQRIAEATRAASYDASDQSSIGRVFKEVVSNF